MYFSRTFKALNFDFQIQGLSRTFKVRANPVIKLLVSLKKKFIALRETTTIPISFVCKSTLQETVDSSSL